MSKKLIFSDEFNYTGKPNAAKWNQETGNNRGNNDEEQWYTKSLDNSYVSNGSLKIVALNKKTVNYNYTSARLNTCNNFSYTYGTLEIRAKLPKGRGAWPALWLLGENRNNNCVPWPLCGEIDLLENVNGLNEIHNSLHSQNHYW